MMNEDITVKGLVGELIGIVMSITMIDICLRNVTYGLFQVVMKVVR